MMRAWTRSLECHHLCWIGANLGRRGSPYSPLAEILWSEVPEFLLPEPERVAVVGDDGHLRVLDAVSGQVELDVAGSEDGQPDLAKRSGYKHVVAAERSV